MHGYVRREHAPRSPHCFWLWLQAYRVSKKKLSAERREQTRQRRNAKYHSDPERRAAILARNKKYLSTDAGRLLRNKFLRAWKKNRYDTDPSFRVAQTMRSRLTRVMARTRRKKQRTASVVGCSPKFLAQHLEKQFKRGMSWENYGTAWHIDHVIPCASFDHAKPDQVAVCWNWQNLRPAFAVQNMQKGSRVFEPQQHLPLRIAA